MIFLSIFFFLTSSAFGFSPEDALLEKVLAEEAHLPNDVFLLPRSSISAFVEPKATVINYRLPDGVVPIKYEILLEPFFEGFFNFSGEVNITAKVLRPVTQIVLHSHNLDIQSVNVVREDGMILGSNFDFNPERHFLNISTGPLFANNVVNINIKYMGVLNGDNRGFYKASYLDKDGKER